MTLNEYAQVFNRISEPDNAIQFMARSFRKEGNAEAINLLIKEIEITLDDIKEGRF